MDIFVRHGLSAPPARWAPDNNILFISNVDNGTATNVWRIPLDQRSWETQDQPEQLTYGTSTIHSFASLPDGRLVFDDNRDSINLWSLPVDTEKGRVTGEAQQITRDEANNIPPWLSADGDKLIYGSNREGRGTWWFRDLKSGRELRLNCPDGSYGAVISPNGKDLVFARHEHSSPDASSSLFVMSVDGGQPEKLIEGMGLESYGWLFTRNQVLYVAGGMRDGGSPQVLLLDVNTKRPQLVLEHNEYRFSWILPSPDDRWISFVALKQGLLRVFIAPLHPDRVTPESEWIPMTDGRGYDD
jgi:Tol biopolymer transport system component